MTPALGGGIYGFFHIIRGPVIVFDIWYGFEGQAPDTGNNPLRRLTVAGAKFDGVRIPAFRLDPETRLKRLGQVLHIERDIDFPSHPTFSERYALYGKDEDETRRLFTPQVLDVWETLPADERWAASGFENSILIYRIPLPLSPDEGEVGPDGLEPFIEAAQRIAQARDCQSI